MKSNMVKAKVIVLVISALFLAAIIEVSLSNTGTSTLDNQLDFVEMKGSYYVPSAVEYVSGEFLVRFKSEIGEDVINAINKKYGVSVKRTLLSGSKLLSVPDDKTVEEMIKIYEMLPEVEYAESNGFVYAFMVPNDEYYDPYQWHLDNDVYGGINMESAWDISTGEGVVVAVLDSGVAYEDYGPYCQAPDLAGTNFVQGYDFVNNDAHPNDDYWHGTHVTGYRTNNQ